MADIKDWSKVAADNNAAPPDGFPENQLPSTLNNGVREMMAATRRWYEDAEWRDFGDTATYVSGTSFTVNSDLTDRYVVNRRIRAVGSTTGTIYGTITASSYSSPDTTVTVEWDSGSLSSETLAMSLGFLPLGATGATTATAAREALGIYSFSVDEDGSTASPFYAPSGWSVSRGSEGVYTVTHNLTGVSGTEYAVVLTVQENSGDLVHPIIRLTFAGSVSFGVEIQEADGTFRDEQFRGVLILQ